MKKILLMVSVAFAVSCLITACGQKGNNLSVSAKDSLDSAPAAAAQKYTLAMVVNKKDLSCGMPLTAGLEDTAHYKGKAYGFCSTECKNEFLKNPAGYIAKMK